VRPPVAAIRKRTVCIPAYFVYTAYLFYVLFADAGICCCRLCCLYCPCVPCVCTCFVLLPLPYVSQPAQAARLIALHTVLCASQPPCVRQPVFCLLSQPCCVTGFMDALRRPAIPTSARPTHANLGVATIQRLTALSFALQVGPR